MHERHVEQVYLDLRSYIAREEILRHFPNIRARCLEFGIDITTDLVPVVPAAHYFCGGVQVDEWGQTNHPDIYAVGEVACTGLHGANRLASTSLLEGLVWGERAAQQIQATLLNQAKLDPHAIPAWTAHQGATSTETEQSINDLLHAVQTVMWEQVSLVRTTAGLATAQSQLGGLQRQIEQLYHTTPLSDETIGLRNTVQSAAIVAAAALANQRSIGCHYRVEETALYSVSA